MKLRWLWALVAVVALTAPTAVIGQESAVDDAKIVDDDDDQAATDVSPMCVHVSHPNHACVPNKSCQGSSRKEDLQCEATEVVCCHLEGNVTKEERAIMNSAVHSGLEDLEKRDQLEKVLVTKNLLVKPYTSEGMYNEYMNSDDKALDAERNSFVIVQAVKYMSYKTPQQNEVADAVQRFMSGDQGSLDELFASFDLPIGEQIPPEMQSELGMKGPRVGQMPELQPENVTSDGNSGDFEDGGRHSQLRPSRSNVHSGAENYECSPTRYRSIDGSCNNLQNPDWGRAFRVYNRLLSAKYSDGIASPRNAVDGSVLPSARLVSSTVCTDEDHVMHDNSLMSMQWGQFIDHEMGFTPVYKARGTNGLLCCAKEIDENPNLLHPECYPIPIPKDDPFYSQNSEGYRSTCMEFVRSLAGPTVIGDKYGGKRQQLNQVSSFVDGSVMYGSSHRESEILRLFKIGQLKSLIHDGREYVPMEITPSCTDPSLCHRVISGDSRANQHPWLTVLHNIFHRDHNYLAYELHVLNPHWDDERLYQETRRIVNAQFQHITYTEFLPSLFGYEFLKQYGLEAKRYGYSNDYDENINPTTLNEFIGAAFRVGHSLIHGTMEYRSREYGHGKLGLLRDHYFSPQQIMDEGIMDKYLLSLMSQVPQRADVSVTKEVTNYLFKAKNESTGLDLIALNIQRGRDHGLQSYNEYRKLCGLNKAYNFEDLYPSIEQNVIDKLKYLYKTVDDVDLFIGGIAEKHNRYSLLGPTFACIIANQFRRVKRGDRFWYEIGHQPNSFTPDQLQELRKTTLGSIICQFADNIEYVQQHVFKQPSPENSMASCKDYDIHRRLDLNKWKHFDSSSPEYDEDGGPKMVRRRSHEYGSPGYAPNYDYERDHYRPQPDKIYVTRGSYEGRGHEVDGYYGGGPGFGPGGPGKMSIDEIPVYQDGSYGSYGGDAYPYGDRRPPPPYHEDGYIDEPDAKSGPYARSLGYGYGGDVDEHEFASASKSAYDSAYKSSSDHDKAKSSYYDSDSRYYDKEADSYDKHSDAHSGAAAAKKHAETDYYDKDAAYGDHKYSAKRRYYTSKYGATKGYEDSAYGADKYVNKHVASDHKEYDAAADKKSSAYDTSEYEAKSRADSASKKEDKSYKSKEHDDKYAAASKASYDSDDSYTKSVKYVKPKYVEPDYGYGKGKISGKEKAYGGGYGKEEAYGGGYGKEAYGGGYGKEAYGGEYGKEAYGGGYGKEAYGGGYGKEAYGGGYGKEAYGGGYGKEAYGSGYGKEAYGGGYGKEAYGSGYGKEAYGGGYGKEAYGSGYGKEAYGGGYGKEAYGGGYGKGVTYGGGGYGKEAYGGGYGKEAYGGGYGKEAYGGGYGKEAYGGGYGKEAYGGGYGKEGTYGGGYGKEVYGGGYGKEGTYGSSYGKEKAYGGEYGKGKAYGGAYGKEENYGSSYGYGGKPSLSGYGGGEGYDSGYGGEYDPSYGGTAMVYETGFSGGSSHGSPAYDSSYSKLSTYDAEGGKKEYVAGTVPAGYDSGYPGKGGYDKSYSGLKSDYGPGYSDGKAGYGSGYKSGSAYGSPGGYSSGAAYKSGSGGYKDPAYGSGGEYYGQRLVRSDNVSDDAVVFLDTAASWNSTSNDNSTVQPSVDLFDAAGKAAQDDKEGVRKERSYISGGYGHAEPAIHEAAYASKAAYDSAYKSNADHDKAKSSHYDSETKAYDKESDKYDKHADAHSAAAKAFKHSEGDHYKKDLGFRDRKYGAHKKYYVSTYGRKKGYEDAVYSADKYSKLHTDTDHKKYDAAADKKSAAYDSSVHTAKYKADDYDKKTDAAYSEKEHDDYDKSSKDSSYKSKEAVAKESKPVFMKPSYDTGYKELSYGKPHYGAYGGHSPYGHGYGGGHGGHAYKPGYGGHGPHYGGGGYDARYPRSQAFTPERDEMIKDDALTDDGTINGTTSTQWNPDGRAERSYGEYGYLGPELHESAYASKAAYDSADKFNSGYDKSKSSYADSAVKYYDKEDDKYASKTDDYSAAAHAKKHSEADYYNKDLAYRDRKYGAHKKYYASNYGSHKGYEDSAYSLDKYSKYHSGGDHKDYDAAADKKASSYDTSAYAAKYKADEYDKTTDSAYSAKEHDDKYKASKASSYKTTAAALKESKPAYDSVHEVPSYDGLHYDGYDRYARSHDDDGGRDNETDIDDKPKEQDEIISDGSDDDKDAESISIDAADDLATKNESDWEDDDDRPERSYGYGYKEPSYAALTSAHASKSAYDSANKYSADSDKYKSSYADSDTKLYDQEDERHDAKKDAYLAAAYAKKHSEADYYDKDVAFRDRKYGAHKKYFEAEYGAKKAYEDSAYSVDKYSKFHTASDHKEYDAAADKKAAEYDSSAYAAKYKADDYDKKTDVAYAAKEHDYKYKANKESSFKEAAAVEKESKPLPVYKKPSYDTYEEPSYKGHGHGHGEYEPKGYGAGGAYDPLRYPRSQGTNETDTVDEDEPAETASETEIKVESDELSTGIPV